MTPSLYTADLPATVRFYTDRLGFTVDTMWPEEEPSLAILDHGSAVHLLFYSEPGEDREGAAMSGQLRFDLEGSVEALHARLAGETEVLWGPEVHHYGRREFSVRDPQRLRAHLQRGDCRPDHLPGRHPGIAGLVSTVRLDGSAAAGKPVSPAGHLRGQTTRSGKKPTAARAPVAAASSGRTRSLHANRIVAVTCSRHAHRVDPRKSPRPGSERPPMPGSV